MKEIKNRNRLFALAGVVSLTVYVLACTSFSPDDTKVLYPGIDPGSGVTAVAVYDRDTKKSRELFVPVVHNKSATNNPAPALIRSQWLDNGRSVLVAFASGEGEDENVRLVIVPWKTSEPVKYLSLPKTKEGAVMLAQPLCISRDKLFFVAADTELVRVDLRSGEVALHDFGTNVASVDLWAGPSEGEVICVQALRDTSGAWVGMVNPSDFSVSPVMELRDSADFLKVRGDQLVLFDLGRKRLAFLGSDEQTNRVVVVENGRVVFSRTFQTPGYSYEFGSGGFLAGGDCIWATCAKTLAGTNITSFGLVELPLNEKPIVDTTLVGAASRKESKAATYFQGSVSHDGKTLAVASTYLAFMDANLSADDCALFLVDLSHADRRVTRVPVAIPANIRKEK
jgi:hypothetical protein